MNVIKRLAIKNLKMNRKRTISTIIRNNTINSSNLWNGKSSYEFSKYFGTTCNKWNRLLPCKTRKYNKWRAKGSRK